MATMNVLDGAGSTVAVEKPLAPGSAADSASRPVAWSTEGKAQIGDVAETAPVSDTASSGLNGRLQRIAQRITSMITLWGAATDAKATQTDATSLTFMQVFKQISASVQTLAAGLATLGTSYDILNNAGGAQKVYLPTDQVVPNKVQSQDNGTTASRVSAAATTNATNLKAGAGAIYNMDVFNVAAYDVFLKFYNKASSPTVGTDTPVWTIPIKAGTGYARTFPNGKWFSTGVSYAITKLQGDSDTTALVAGDATGSIDWK